MTDDRNSGVVYRQHKFVCIYPLEYGCLPPPILSSNIGVKFTFRASPAYIFFISHCSFFLLLLNYFRLWFFYPIVYVSNVWTLKKFQWFLFFLSFYCFASCVLSSTHFLLIFLLSFFPDSDSMISIFSFTSFPLWHHSFVVR